MDSSCEWVGPVPGDRSPVRGYRVRGRWSCQRRQGIGRGHQGGLCGDPASGTQWEGIRLEGGSSAALHHRLVTFCALGSGGGTAWDRRGVGAHSQLAAAREPGAREL